VRKTNDVMVRRPDAHVDQVVLVDIVSTVDLVGINISVYTLSSC